MSTLTRSALFFVLAVLMEIGGGYLMWLCLRERWPGGSGLSARSCWSATA